MLTSYLPGATEEHWQSPSLSSPGVGVLAQGDQASVVHRARGRPCGVASQGLSRGRTATDSAEEGPSLAGLGLMAAQVGPKAVT